MSNSPDKLENDPGPTLNGQEPKIESPYTHQKYQPEDFSQLAINRGQRRINYELTEAAKKFSEALQLLTEALVKTSSLAEGDLAQVKKLVAEAAAISNTVAGIDPPGCAPPPPPPPPKPIKQEIIE